MAPRTSKLKKVPLTREEAFVSGATIDVDHYPLIPPGFPPRRLCFNHLTSLDAEVLRGRGYEPISIITLPRDTALQNQEYLLAFLQGVQEGTIFVDKLQMEALQAGLKSAGLMTEKRVNFTVTANLDNMSARELLNWDNSRHTLVGNSTIGKNLLEAADRDRTPAGLVSDLDLGSDRTPSVSTQRTTASNPAIIPASFGAPGSVVPETRQAASKTVRTSTALKGPTNKPKFKPNKKGQPK